MIYLGWNIFISLKSKHTLVPAVEISSLIFFSEANAWQILSQEKGTTWKAKHKRCNFGKISVIGSNKSLNLDSPRSTPNKWNSCMLLTWNFWFQILLPNLRLKDTHHSDVQLLRVWILIWELSSQDTSQGSVIDCALKHSKI